MRIKVAKIKGKARVTRVRRYGAILQRCARLTMREMEDFPSDGRFWENGDFA